MTEETVPVGVFDELLNVATDMAALLIELQDKIELDDEGAIDAFQSIYERATEAGGY